MGWQIKPFIGAAGVVLGANIWHQMVGVWDLYMVTFVTQNWWKRLEGHGRIAWNWRRWWFLVGFFHGCDGCNDWTTDVCVLKKQVNCAKHLWISFMIHVWKVGALLPCIVSLSWQHSQNSNGNVVDFHWEIDLLNSISRLQFLSPSTCRKPSATDGT